MRKETTQAVVLGLIQGPTELLPVSSSAHLASIPALAGWDWHRFDPEFRKSFEVALHGGAALALILLRRDEIREIRKRFDRRHVTFLALSFLPPAVAGVLFERTIEARLGGSRATAAGLIAGAVAMAVADLRPGHRDRDRVTALDGLALGLAQAAALVPGVSRNGATLTAARLRGFSRKRASVLSRSVALPVILGAAGLKGVRLVRRRIEPEGRRLLALGFGTATLSTLLSGRMALPVDRGHSLLPWAAYRIGFATLILKRSRR